MLLFNELWIKTLSTCQYLHPIHFMHYWHNYMILVLRSILYITKKIVTASQCLARELHLGKNNVCKLLCSTKWNLLMLTLSIYGWLRTYKSADNLHFSSYYLQPCNNSFPNYQNLCNFYCLKSVFHLFIYKHSCNFKHQ